MGSSGCIWANLFYLGKLVLFGQKWFYLGKGGILWAKLVLFGQRWLYLAKEVVLGKRCLYLGKHSSIWAKVFVFGQICSTPVALIGVRAPGLCIILAVSILLLNEILLSR